MNEIIVSKTIEKLLNRVSELALLSSNLEAQLEVANDNNVDLSNEINDLRNTIMAFETKTGLFYNKDSGSFDKKEETLNVTDSNS